ncbi:MAG: hypothetical protein ACLQGP_18725 [Isosphaeraceae bacterium]
MMLERTRLAGLLLPAGPLLLLAACCFARLGLEPGGLIVDGHRPSVDYANRGDPRPVGNDLVFLFLPHHGSIGQRLARFGHWPVWDARGFAGRPLVGNPQAGLFYPPVWAAWRTQNPAALGWLTIGHLIWAGLGVYVLMRAMGQGRWASTVAAAVYQASPLLMAQTFEGHYPHVWAVCWYPWAFWAYREYRNSRARGFLPLPPILTMTYLTGHPQEWFLLVLALSMWAAVDLLWGVTLCPSRIANGASGRALVFRDASTRFVGWFAILALSIGITAVDVVPQWMVRPWLRRNHEPGIDVGIPRRYHLGGLNGFQMLSPTALGGPSDYIGDDNYWETVFSIGLAPLSLAVLAAARHPDRRLIRGWLVLAGLAIAFACGRELGLYPLVYSFVPGMRWFRVPARSLFLANLAGAVLAGMGVEVLRLRMTDSGTWRGFARRFVMVAVVLVGFLFLIQVGRVPSGADGRSSAGESHRTLPRMMVSSRYDSVQAPASPPSSRRTARAANHVLHDGGFWFALVGMSLLCLWGCRPIDDRSRRRLGNLFGLIAIAELGWCGYALIQVAPASRFLMRDPISTALATSDGVPSSDAKEGQPSDALGPLPIRIKARDSFYGDLPASLHGIEKTNVDDAFQIDHASVFYETLYPVASHVRPMAERLLKPSAKDSWRRIRQAVFDRMSVTHIVSDRVESDPGWPVAAEGDRDGSRFVIQRNPTAMPRAYVVPRASILPDHGGVVLTSLNDFDPHASVIMNADPLTKLPPGPRQPFTAAEWNSSDPDRPSLCVTTHLPGLLVVADTWMPGWTATVDGRPAPLLRGNHSQRVIPLPESGRHIIAMDYRPPGFVAGRAITILSVAAWMLIAGFRTCTERELNHGSPSAAKPHPQFVYRRDRRDRRERRRRREATARRGPGATEPEPDDRF